MDARGAFFQEPPRLGNTYEADRALAGLLQRLLPPDLHGRLRPEWQAMGEAAAGPLLALARQAEAERPRHVPFDAWGRRIDAIEVSAAWTQLQAEAAQRGLYAIPYEPDLREQARLHQAALLALYAPSSAIASCPLAMTDGAARTLLEHDRELAQRIVPRLATRDAGALWTCGQWMTERAGGSDVSGTETVARADEGGLFRLHGCKWFTSAVTSQAALTLARMEGAPAGNAGLSLFFLELRRPDGGLNGIRVDRLKDKLGTRALPTAELTLEGALARPVGAPGHGVRKIT
ncbi:MAG TPA: acyl-CoA dehydrogenase family protein, partial [Vicinamibacteria bacterium]|nr:acyl-CoA dehydrogenase family protein [Vicinamibacteria bacterium]